MSELIVSGISEAKPPPPVAGPGHHLVLPAIRDVTLIAAVYLFFAGYSFRQTYLSLLGIPLNVDASLNIVLLDAFPVFKDNVWLPVALVIAACALSYSRIRDLLDAAFLPVIMLVAIGSFFLLGAASQNAAKAEVHALRCKTSSLPTVSMTFKDPSKQADELRRAACGGGLYCADTRLSAYLVDASPDTYYVLVQTDPIRTDPKFPCPQLGSTYTVVRSDVQTFAELLHDEPPT